MVQLLGVPFAFIFGALGGRLGTKRAIFLALAVYTVAATLGYFMQNATHFFLLAGLVATVQGGAQALSRSLFSRLIPPAKTSEYFGFYAVVERFATILGPLVFTLSGALTGSSRSAVLGMIAFFVAGGWLLSRVDVAAGERAARAVYGRRRQPQLAKLPAASGTRRDRSMPPTPRPRGPRGEAYSEPAR